MKISVIQLHCQLHSLVLYKLLFPIPFFFSYTITNAKTSGWQEWMLGCGYLPPAAGKADNTWATARVWGLFSGLIAEISRCEPIWHAARANCRAPATARKTIPTEGGRCGEGWKTESKNLIGRIRLVMQAVAVGGQQKSKSNLASLQAYAYFPMLLFSIRACINRWYALFSQWAGLAANAE